MLGWVFLGVKCVCMTYVCGLPHACFTRASAYPVRDCVKICMYVKWKTTLILLNIITISIIKFLSKRSHFKNLSDNFYRGVWQKTDKIRISNRSICQNCNSHSYKRLTRSIFRIFSIGGVREFIYKNSDSQKIVPPFAAWRRHFVSIQIPVNVNAFGPLEKLALDILYV